MRFISYLSILGIFLGSAANVAADEKTLSEHWKTTELTWSVLEGELNNKTCRANLESFMGCLHAASELVAFADPKQELVIHFGAGRGKSLQRFGIVRVNERGKAEAPAEKFIDRFKANQERGKKLRELWNEAFLKHGEHVEFEAIFTWLGKQFGGDRIAEAVGVGMNAFLHVSRDPHSRLQPLSFLQSLREKSSLEYSGVGMIIAPFENKVMVQLVFDGTPASKGGMRPFDVIDKINERSTAGLDVIEVASLLRQSKGTKLKLAVTRNGKVEEVQLVCDEVSVSHVSHAMLTDENRRKMGYLKIREFGSKTICKQASDSLRTLLKDGAEGLVLDLRGNPGGLAAQAVCVAGLFLEKGKLVYSSHSLTGTKKEPEATTTEPLTSLPLIVLVDQHSASSAEVLAGALQDHGRALIVGIRTYGKGNGQELHPWKKSDKVIFSETLFYALLPGGTAYQLIGIYPDFHEVYARPEPTEMDKFAPREADLYFNPVKLSGVRFREAPRESDKQRKLQECVDKEGMASKRFDAGDGKKSDFQLLKAQDALFCVLQTPR